MKGNPIAAHSLRSEVRTSRERHHSFGRTRAAFLRLVTDRFLAVDVIRESKVHVLTRANLLIAFCQREDAKRRESG